jgi:hypothetical protein
MPEYAHLLRAPRYDYPPQLIRHYKLDHAETK